MAKQDDAQKLASDIESINGQEINQLIIYNTPDKIVNEAKTKHALFTEVDRLSEVVVRRVSNNVSVYDSCTQLLDKARSAISAAASPFDANSVIKYLAEVKKSLYKAKQDTTDLDTEINEVIGPNNQLVEYDGQGNINQPETKNRLSAEIDRLSGLVTREWDNAAVCDPSYKALEEARKLISAPANPWVPEPAIDKINEAKQVLVKGTKAKHDTNISDHDIEEIEGPDLNKLVIYNSQDKTVNEAETKHTLSAEADRLSKLLTEEANSAAVCTSCTPALDEARGLISAPANKFDPHAVMIKLYEVRRRLVRATKSRYYRKHNFKELVSVTIILFAILLAIMIPLRLVPGFEGMISNLPGVILACAVWGGLGGVLDAFIAIHTHFSDQDFDIQYKPWYYLHPLTGLGLGVIVFLIVQAGLLAVGTDGLSSLVSGNATTAANAATNTTSDNARTSILALPIAIAFLAGFKQTSAIGFVTRIVKSIFEKDSSGTSSGGTSSSS